MNGELAIVVAPGLTRVPGLEKRLATIKGLATRHPWRKVDWAIDECQMLQTSKASKSRLIEMTKVRFGPGATDAFTDEQAARVIAAVRETFCNS